MLNFYNVLNLASNASADEIRSKYRSLLLQNHSDKLGEKASESSDAFVRLLHKIWTTLRNERLREEYDLQLKQSNLSQSFVIGDMLSVSDLDEDTQWDCRCGNSCLLLDHFEQENVMILGCDFCSQIILVDLKE